MAQVLEYKCPCCNAGLKFGAEDQRLKCEYCDNAFDLETVQIYNDCEYAKEEAFHWEKIQHSQWSEDETHQIRAFQCPSCGGEIVSDEHTAATFCPFCDNPAIIPTRVSGGLKPDAILPFKNTKEDAKNAFLRLCKGKVLLPKGYTSVQRLEKITGMYVPFWLYDCAADYETNYKATRVRHWSDSRYQYTKTDHFLLRRKATASFLGIPMDGSSKIADDSLESIEPFDYNQMVDFDTAYLSGYYADRYDVESQQGQPRIRQRVEESMTDALQDSLIGYSTVIPTTKCSDVHLNQTRYVLLPVWMLNSQYNGKNYTFLMNGQTGKITGSLPVCKRRTVAWFTGICAGVTAAITLLQYWALS